MNGVAGSAWIAARLVHVRRVMARHASNPLTGREFVQLVLAAAAVVAYALMFGET